MLNSQSSGEPNDNITGLELPLPQAEKIDSTNTAENANCQSLPDVDDRQFDHMPAGHYRSAAFYLKLVLRIATGLAKTVPLHVSLDDLIATGNLALVEAFEFNKKLLTIATVGELKAYLSIRIRGAIRDYLRSMDPLTRKHRETIKALAKWQQKANNLYGTDDAETVAAVAEIGIDEYYKRQRLVITHIPLSDLHKDDHNLPDKDIETQIIDAITILELLDLLKSGIMKPRLAEIIKLYYLEEMSCKEIGKIMGISESGVYILRIEAEEILQKQLGIQQAA